MLSNFVLFPCARHGGLIFSAFDSRLSGPGSSPGGDIVLYSLARHFTLTVPLSTQTGKFNAGGGGGMGG